VNPQLKLNDNFLLSWYLSLFYYEKCNIFLNMAFLWVAKTNHENHWKKEHKRSRTLKYACRICRYSEDAKNPLIYRNVLKKEVGNVLHTVPGTVSDDPTLSRSQNASCKSCGHNEAVFFQSDTSDVRSDTLKLIFVCCNCNHKWVA